MKGREGREGGERRERRRRRSSSAPAGMNIVDAVVLVMAEAGRTCV